jgi:hypothetical protein
LILTVVVRDVPPREYCKDVEGASLFVVEGNA